MTKDELKIAIKEAFVKQKNPTSQDAALESVSSDISNAISTYVVEELEKLKAKLVEPGAFALSTASEGGTSNVTPGTITTYKPGI
jgi:hypothetical protein